MKCPFIKKTITIAKHDNSFGPTTTTTEELGECVERECACYDKSLYKCGLRRS